MTPASRSVHAYPSIFVVLFCYLCHSRGARWREQLHRCKGPRYHRPLTLDVSLLRPKDMMSRHLTREGGEAVAMRTINVHGEEDDRHSQDGHSTDDDATGLLSARA